MKLKLAFLLLVLIQISCNQKEEKQVSTITKNQKTEFKKSDLSRKNKIKFDFEKFKISKGKVGEIKIGMKIRDAEKFLNQLTKTETEAYDFGFDGGGSAYVYSLENEPIIALIPKRDFDEILAIAALNKNLKTKNGLNPKSTVAEIIAKYPDIKVNQNVMMDWEFIQDTKNSLQFIFETNENNKLGEYIEMETPAIPTKTNIKADWIEIR